MTGRIRKAVIPVAGLGTRILPATKAIPKEMLPIVDKPLIQYCVEEAVEAGVDQIIFITSQSKRAIEDHFDRSPALESALHLRDRHDLLTGLDRVLPPHVRYACVRQPQPLGLGHAVLCARSLIGDEPFAIILPDDVMDAQPSALAQLIERFDELGHSMIAVEPVAREDTRKYGIVDVVPTGDSLRTLIDIVEKPHPSVAPSTLGVVGRYVLMPEIFRFLEALTPGAGGEIQLTDGIRAMLADHRVSALQFTGKRFDCGSKLGYVAATLHFALKHPEVGAAFALLVSAVAADIGRPVVEPRRSVAA
jgi:UTP--glucose-1-phosphate uridylyltransferase